MCHKLFMMIVLALCCKLFAAEKPAGPPAELQVPPIPYEKIKTPDWVQGAVTVSRQDSSNAEYECRKIASKIVIDGKPDEWAWRKAPSIPFTGYVTNESAPYPTSAKLLWDDEYLYVAYFFDEPDIRAYWSFTSANAPACVWENYERNRFPNPEANHTEDRIESRIMMMDRFAKFFLDPDGNGTNYMELHINALNNHFHNWYSLPLQGRPLKKIGGPSAVKAETLFSLPGLKSAVFVEGTVNAPDDIDKGWTVELAIPWDTLQLLSEKKRMPKPGESWGLHLGRVFRVAPGAGNEYWGWPFLEVRASHQTEKYGKLTFRDHPRFQSFFVLGLPASEESIVQAGKMGVTAAAIPPDFPARLRTLAESLGIATYPTVSLLEWDEKKDGETASWQKLNAEQQRFFESMQGRDRDPADPDYALRVRGIRDSTEYQWGGTPAASFRRKPDEVYNGQVLCVNHPATIKAIKKRIHSICSAPNNKGLVLEGIGFQNHTGCHCPCCAAFKKQGTAPLVKFADEMTAYAKSLRRDMRVIVHPFPASALTAALTADNVLKPVSWYNYRDPWKIRTDSKNCSATPSGFPLLAFGDRKTDLAMPEKTPERISFELEAILDGGAKDLAIMGFDALLRHPEIVAVFRKYGPQGKALPASRKD